MASKLQGQNGFSTATRVSKSATALLAGQRDQPASSTFPFSLVWPLLWGAFALLFGVTVLGSGSGSGSGSGFLCLH